MTDLKKAAQQALEALKCLVETYEMGNTIRADIMDAEEAIAAIKTALAEPNRAQKMRDAGYTRRPTLREMAEPVQEQEPVAWMWEQQARRNSTGIGGWDRLLLFCRPAEDPFVPKRNITPLYTHPPRREWRSLSEEEMKDLWAAHGYKSAMCKPFARAIEAALRSKNHD
jgi:hypothetical protein